MLRLLRLNDITKFSDTSRCIYNVAISLRKGENTIKEYLKGINGLLTALDLSEFRKGSINTNKDDDIIVSFSDIKVLATTYTLPNDCGRCAGKDSCRAYKSSRYSYGIQELLLKKM